MVDNTEQLNKINQRLDALEKKTGNTSLFGRSYSTFGSSASDFIIKTKGQIKIQWGNKFIDLLKDGKINVDAEFIYKASEAGTKDGIYVLDDGSVVLVAGNQQLNLTTSEQGGTTYVSYLE